MKAAEPIVRTRKPVKCPACGHRPVADILYGLPSPTPEQERKEAAGLIVFGGCVVVIDDPFDKRWECSRCGQQIALKKRLG